jgi:NAD(P)-dependent dehydrogenase (short-subunit alcohol dehydrogenase family)
MASESTQQLKCNQLFDVSHVTAVLTGGGSGIGLMITQALIANGARVYVVDRRKEALDTVLRLYNTGPGEIIPQDYPEVLPSVRFADRLFPDSWPILASKKR